MKSHRGLAIATLVSVLSVTAFAVIIEACSVAINFRSYLSGGLWRPPWRYVGELAAGLPPESGAYQPYAGMRPDSDGRMERARTAYRALFSNTPTEAQIFSGRALNWPEATIQ